MSGQGFQKTRTNAGSARAPDLPALPKSATGIDGLDEILGGGFPHAIVIDPISNLSTAGAALDAGATQPLGKIIGDLSDTERALVGLQLRPRT